MAATSRWLAQATATIGAAASTVAASSASSDSARWGLPRPPKTLPSLESTSGGVLLLTDLDGTLYSHSHGPEGSRALVRFNRHWLKAEDDRSILCYNTARNMKDYRDLVSEGMGKNPPCHLMVPDVLCTGGGTAVQWRNPDTGELELDAAWSAKVHAEWVPLIPVIEAWLEEFDQHHIDDLNTEPDTRAGLTVLGAAQAAAARDALQARLGSRVVVYAMESWVAGVYMVTASPPTATKRCRPVYVWS